MLLDEEAVKLKMDRVTEVLGTVPTVPEEALMTVGLLLKVTVPEDRDTTPVAVTVNCPPDVATITNGADERVTVPLDRDIVPVTRYVPVVRTWTKPDEADTMSWFPSEFTLARLPDETGSPIAIVCRIIVLPTLTITESSRWPEEPTAGGT